MYVAHPYIFQGGGSDGAKFRLDSRPQSSSTLPGSQTEKLAAHLKQLPGATTERRERPRIKSKSEVGSKAEHETLTNI